MVWVGEVWESRRLKILCCMTGALERLFIISSNHMLNTNHLRRRLKGRCSLWMGGHYHRSREVDMTLRKVTLHQSLQSPIGVKLEKQVPPGWLFLEHISIIFHRYSKASPYFKYLSFWGLPLHMIFSTSVLLQQNIITRQLINSKSTSVGWAVQGQGICKFGV